MSSDGVGKDTNRGAAVASQSRSGRSVAVAGMIVLLLVVSHAAVAVYVQNNPVQQLNYSHLFGSLAGSENDLRQISPRSTCVRWSDVVDDVTPTVVSISEEDSSAQIESGFFIDDEGHLVTNYRTIQDAEGELLINLSNSYSYYVDVIGWDSLSDVAVLKARGKFDYVPATIGRSKEIDIGQAVATVGAPYGYKFSLSTGVVSAVNRPYWVWVADPDGEAGKHMWTAVPVIQTDTAINPGNRGGPLFDSSGDVVGMVLGLHSLDDSDVEPLGSSGLNFAVPIDLVMKVANRIIASQSLTRPVNSASNWDFTSSQFTNTKVTSGDDTVFGVEVIDVPRGSLASRAGLSVGDVITGINDRDTPTDFALNAALKYCFEGESVRISYVRDGERNEVVVDF